MHVAIVGAGALGVAFGVRLAAEGGCRVSFVVRASRAGDAAPMRLERIEDGTVLTLDAPERVAAIPPDADVILVAVRAEQVDAALVEQLRPATERDVPVVVMTPLMPRSFAELVQAFGPNRVFAGMPGVVSYGSAPNTVRHWLPKVAHTLVDEPRPPRADITSLVKHLNQAGIDTRLELGVHETNPATTVTFMPIAFGIDVAGSIDALLHDHDLLELCLDAAKETIELAHRIGKVATWASLLLKFVGPHTLKMGVGLARMKSHEAVEYVELHFGHKLHAQNVAMGESILALAVEKGAPHDATARLLARLKAHA